MLLHERRIDDGDGGGSGMPPMRSRMNPSAKGGRPNRHPYSALPSMMRRFRCFLLLSLLYPPRAVASIPASIGDLIDNENLTPLNGRICAYGDMDKNTYTDVILQLGNKLQILLQSEQGSFHSEESGVKFADILLDGVGDNEVVYCSVGDFNGDTAPDVIVVRASKHEPGTQTYTATVYLASENATERTDLLEKPLGFTAHSVLSLQATSGGEAQPQTFIDIPAVLDINGDGISDILGFWKGSEPGGDGGAPRDRSRLFCATGSTSVDSMLKQSCEDKFSNYSKWGDFEPYVPFAPIIADIDGDYNPELILGRKEKPDRKPDTPTRLKLEVFSIYDEHYNWHYNEALSPPASQDANHVHLGGVIVADFNADSIIELLVPVCSSETCTKVNSFLVYSNGRQTTLALEPKSYELVVDPLTRTIFRVGDFNLNGYPDLIATVKADGKTTPIILENMKNGDNTFFTRKFAYLEPRLVMPPEVAKGEISLSAFFDLKEDGKLDILVDFTSAPEGGIGGSKERKVAFIKCDDKGDTTFLKVQVFTNVCFSRCPATNASSKSTSLRKMKKGSLIAWTGPCVGFSMDDSWGNYRKSQQCQLPQNSHQAFHSPFVLFGLDRSPNFVDIVTISSPVWNPTPRSNDEKQRQRRTTKAIVPNSRLMVLPPDYHDPDSTEWDIRLYLTPNRLIIQSLLVLVSVCSILLLVIVALHFRERQQDFKERQAQTHRFHFDAM